MKDYQNEIKILVDAIGSIDNIKMVTHCVTRLRFVLIDDKKVDLKKIESIESVKGTFTQAGQFQIIIGNNVSEFYNQLIEMTGLERMNKEQVKSEAKNNQNSLQKIIGNLGEIFAPLIPALICGGLILGFRNVIDSIAFFDNGTKTLVEISQFWKGVDDFLWLIGEAVFHFLPIPIVWSITKKMGTSQVLGIILGITLVSPQLLNAYLVGSTNPNEIPVWDFGFAQIQMIGYQAQVIPAILAGFTLVYLEKFFRRYTPESISMIVVPFCALIPAVFISHVILGPIGWQIGTWISNLVWGGLTSSLNWVFAGIFGFLYAPLVITGLHHMTNAIDTQLVADFGGTLLWPMIALSNIAQGSSVLAMYFLQKNNMKAKEINIPACISCYLGVTEPALFGVNLKYLFPFIAGMIGSSLAAIYSVATNTKAASIGVGGLPGILSILPNSMFNFFIAMLIAIIVAFSITYVIGKKKLPVEDSLGKEVIKAPITGKVVALNEVPDDCFAQKIMGDGMAIEIENENIVAPVNGEVIMTFPTKHAIGIKTSNGSEILIHLGINTVELNGEGFENFVNIGDKVKTGDLIAKVDINYIKKNNKSLISPIIVTSKENIKILAKNSNVKINEDIFEVV